MGLVAGVPIVTVEEIERITHDGDLAALDRGGGTIDGLRAEATAALMRWARAKGYDPAKIKNVETLKHAAAHWVCFSLFRSMPQGEGDWQLKAEAYQRAYGDALRTATLQTDDENARTAARPRLPKFGNLDAAPAIGGPIDNRMPGRPPSPLFETR